MIARVPEVNNINEHLDVQGSLDDRNIAIQKVGIKDYRIPIEVVDRSVTQTTKANCTLSVSLPADQRGSHLSRFINFMHENNENLSFQAFTELTHKLNQIQDSDSSQIELKFTFFKEKKAPISGIKSMMDYEVIFIAANQKGEDKSYIKVDVPVTSLCPCSKKISDYGAHNQRSIVSVTVNPVGQETVWIEDIIDMVETNASSELYGLLKREDEKYVTEKAYDNPKFVEDMVRDMAVSLENDNRIHAYKIEVENFESIHNHSAFAVIDKITM